MNIYDYTVKDAQGNDVQLAQFKGKTLLIVNVASKCGHTPQYAGLEELYQKYQNRGLVIVGFPCNQFMGQEPGTNAEIQTFCQLNYGVTFPIMAKIKVNGKDADPLYQYLTSSEQNEFSGRITWNFTKFLINKEGKIKNRFDPKMKPQDFATAIEAIL